MISKFLKSFVVCASFLIGGWSPGVGSDYFDFNAGPESGKVRVYMLREHSVTSQMRSQIEGVVKENELTQARKQFKDSRADRAATSRSVRMVAEVLKKGKRSGADMLALCFSARTESKAPVGFSLFCSDTSNTQGDSTFFRGSFDDEELRDYFQGIMQVFKVDIPQDS